MWELIRENKRKSIIVFMAMGIVLMALSYLIGAVWFPPGGGFAGVIIAVLLWVIWSLISYFSGSSIVLLSSHAKRVTPQIHPQLFNVVEEMKIAAGLPVMPEVYIIDEPSPNAFATGRDPSHSAIAVTAGLLNLLNRDELEGVISHEMSHILNRDILYMTFCGVMLGSIVMISEVFLRSLWYTGSSRRYRSSLGGGQGQVIVMVAAIVLALLAPLLAYIFYFSISRKREYLADASGVRLTRYPEGLASALEKISRTNIPLPSANKITAPMYIAAPIKKNKRSKTVKAHLFDTHPPIEERIKILRNMMQGAGYINYLEAFHSVTGDKGPIMPPSALHDTNDISIRKPSVEKEEPSSPKKQARQLGDLMRAVNNYVFLTCACGLKIKIPPDFKQSKVTCPRCGRKLDVPIKNIKNAAAVMGAAKIHNDAGIDGQHIEKPFYVRKARDGWESLSCPCGNLIQISPDFSGKYVVCPHCGRKIEVVHLS